MGQYFFFVNLDKKEFISPLAFDNGMKEMEHSFVGNRYVDACIKLLSNRWKGDRIVHIGDYADELLDNPKFSKILNQIIKDYRLEEDKEYSDETHKCYHFSKVFDDENPDVKEIQPKDIKGSVGRYILVDDDKYIDRLNVKFGENYQDTGFYKYHDDKSNKDYISLLRVDNFTLAIALGEGSGGSYHFEKGTIQEDLHGSLAGHRFESTNKMLKFKKMIHQKSLLKTIFVLNIGNNISKTK